MAAQVDSDSVNILLVGMAGEGKSSTGNTILGREIFEAKKNSILTTEKCQGAVATTLDYNVFVVDSPGLVNMGLETGTRLERLSDEIRMISTSQPDGFDAILIVIQYERELSQDDKSLFRMLKALFGKDYIKQRGISTITHADYYDPEENENMAIEDCLQIQGGLFQKFRENCSYRLIAFDNKTSNRSVRQNQVRHLLEMVVEMRKQSDHHTPEIFLPAVRKRIASFLQRERSVSLKTRDNWLKIFLRDLGNTQLESFGFKQLRKIHAKLTRYHQVYTEKNADKSELTELISRISKLEDDIIARLDDIQNVTEPGGGRALENPEDSKTYRIGEDFISILLVGKAGNGKSATGNSITGARGFESKATTTSTTKKCQGEVARVQDHNLVIVDCPGLADMDITFDGGLQQFTDEIINIFAIHPHGFDVILINISLDSRLTEEDNQWYNSWTYFLEKTMSDIVEFWW